MIYFLLLFPIWVDFSTFSIFWSFLVVRFQSSDVFSLFWIHFRKNFSYLLKINFQTFWSTSRNFKYFLTFQHITKVISYLESCEIGISKVRFFCDNDIRGFSWLSLVHVSTRPEFRLSVQISDLEVLIRIPQSSACI